MTTSLLFNYFANSLWQVPLLALCTWAALRLARPSIRVRYALWIAALLLSTVLPLRGAVPEAASTITVDLSDPAYDAAFTRPIPIPRVPFYALTILPRTRDLLAGLYLALTGVLGLRLLASCVAVRRLVGGSTPRTLTALEAAIVKSTARQASAVACTIRTLPASHTTPLVAGIFHPVVLLPIAFDDPEALRAVLAHEFAHIRRRDVLVNLALRILALPIAYHPATTLLHRRIRHTREMLCDALAVRALPSPNAYANTLLALATTLLRPGAHTPHSTVGLFERTSKPLLEERIMTLIAPPTPLRFAARILRVTAATLVFAAAPSAATLIHLTPSVLAAQEPGSPSAQQAAQTPSPAPQPATPPVVLLSPGQRDLSPDQRKRLEDSLHATTEEVLKSTQPLRDPAFQKQMNDLAHHSIDPAMQARLKQLQNDLADSAVNSPEFKKSMEDLRVQFDSPEFKQQIREASEQARKAARESVAQKKILEDLGKQFNSPEFKQQIAAARTEALKHSQIDQVQLQKQLAEAQLSLATAAGTLSAAPQEPSPTARISAGVMAGQIESKVQPVYPADAKAAHISGSVVLHALIAKDGHIQALEVISGPEELRTSALDAVSKWIYKPYLLNGQPTVVDTTITVNYSIAE